MTNHGATEARTEVKLGVVSELMIGHGYIHKEPNWKIFSGWRWREAIIAFLNGRWRDDMEIRDLCFVSEVGNILTLRAEVFGPNPYIVFGRTSAPSVPSWAKFHPYLAEMQNSAQVEQGLIRLVRSNAVHYLNICSETWRSDLAAKNKQIGRMVLAKRNDEPTVLRIACENIPDKVTYF